MPQQQSRRRILQLLREYPFLKDIYGHEETAKSHGCEFNPVIKVKRGDPDLMFRQADDVNGVNVSLGDPQHPGIRGTRYEYYRAVSQDEQIGEVHDWRDRNEHYVRDLFSHRSYEWGGQSVIGGLDPFKVVDSIVWVCVETWYPEATRFTDYSISNSPVRIDLSITVYQKPRNGWQELYRTADPLVNVELYGWRLISGPNLEDSFHEVIYDRLNRLAQEFQEKVWTTGFGKIVDDSRMKGMSGQYGNVKVLTYVIAGRLRVQFERDGTMVNFAGLDELDDPRLGFGSIVGKLPEVEKMVREVIKFWENADEETRQSIHQNDSNVGMGF